MSKCPAYPPFFQLSHPGGGSGGGFFDVSAGSVPTFGPAKCSFGLRVEFCATFFWPFSFIPFCKEPPRSASSIFFVDLLIAVRRVLASIVSGDLRLGQFVNIHASFRTVGQACGVARVAFHLVRPS